MSVVFNALFRLTIPCSEVIRRQVVDIVPNRVSHIHILGPQISVRSFAISSEDLEVSRRLSTDPKMCDLDGLADFMKARQSKPTGTPLKFGWNRGGVLFSAENLQYL